MMNPRQIDTQWRPVGPGGLLVLGHSRQLLSSVSHPSMQAQLARSFTVRIHQRHPGYHTTGTSNPTGCKSKLQPGFIWRAALQRLLTCPCSGQPVQALLQLAAGYVDVCGSQCHIATGTLHDPAVHQWCTLTASHLQQYTPKQQRLVQQG